MAQTLESARGVQNRFRGIQAQAKQQRDELIALRDAQLSHDGVKSSFEESRLAWNVEKESMTKVGAFVVEFWPFAYF